MSTPSANGPPTAPQEPLSDSEKITLQITTVALYFIIFFF